LPFNYNDQDGGVGEEMVANIVVIMNYPPDKANELGPIAVKVFPTLPKYIRRVGESRYCFTTENDHEWRKGK
jgi:hypothetical protein